MVAFARSNNHTGGNHMSSNEEKVPVRLDAEQEAASSRRTFLQRSVLAGAAGAAGLGVLLASPSANALSALTHGGDDREDDDPGRGKKRDTDILIAAEIAEALAVTTYTHIINTAPFFTRIPSDDQGYLRGARQEEMSHYLLEQSVTGQPTPFTSFFYPKGMFEDTQTTLNVLVTLEDAFIAAYLVGVRDFSTRDLRVTAARIMGIESDHRTLARVIGPDDQYNYRIARRGRKRGAAQQQRLRTHPVLDENRTSRRCADALRGHHRRESGRVRCVEVVRLQPVYSNPAQSLGSIYFFRRLLVSNRTRGEVSWVHEPRPL
jgi:hypothetical protein